MPRLHIDIESFGTVDLTEVGVYVYANHPDTRIRCISVALDDGAISTPVKFGQNWPSRYRLSGLTLAAHNAEFERVMLNGPPGQRIGFPKTELNQWLCTAFKAAIHGLPRNLEDLLNALKLEQRIDKDKRKNMLLLSKPLYRSINKQRTRIIPTPETHPAEFEKWYADCEADVAGERAVDQLLPDPIPSEQRLYALDQTINERGFWTNQDMVRQLIEIREEHLEKLVNECMQLSGLEPSQRDAVKGWLASKGIELENLRANTVKDNLHRHRVLEIRRETSKSSTAKLDRMVVCAGRDHRVRGAHLVHGATPGRWTGKLVQSQNLPKPLIDEELCVELAKLIPTMDLATLRLLVDSVMDTMASLLRCCIQAPPGRILRVGDFTAVESVIVAWLCGEDWKLDAFKRTGKAPYEAIAARMFKVTEKFFSDYEKEHGHKHEYRDLGKRTELLGQYAGGPAAIERSPGFDKIDPQPSRKEVQEWVDRWREANPQIKNSWKVLAQLCIRAIETRTVQSGYHCKFGVVNYGGKIDFLRIQLPSKRSIYFAEPMVHVKEMYWNETTRRYQDEPIDGQQPKVMKEWSHMAWIKGMWLRDRTHGGVTLQNITEAFGRDLLVNGMFNVEEAGYPVIMHIHDELVAETAEDQGSTEEFLQLMTKLPDWAPDFPLRSAGYSGSIYHKD